MSGRSRAISHTTLHEAAQGNRLPSWETTVEFVKACGGDPADYRARWEQASQAVQAAGAQRQVVPERGAITPPATGRVPADAPAVGEAAGPVPDVSDGPTTVEPPAAADPRPGGSRRLRAAIVGVAAAAVVAIVVVVVSRSGRGTPNPSARRSSAAALTPTDCPIRRSNPPLAPPAHKGDASTLIVDVTLPDCSHIRRGSTVTKI